MRLSPCIERARNDIASKSTPGYWPVHFVVIQQSLTDNEDIVITVCPMGSPSTTPKQDNRAGVKDLNETADRLGESCIMHRPVLHTDNISNRARKSNRIGRTAVVFGSDTTRLKVSITMAAIGEANVDFGDAFNIVRMTRIRHLDHEEGPV